jgi:hypothetical protein
MGAWGIQPPGIRPRDSRCMHYSRQKSCLGRVVRKSRGAIDCIKRSSHDGNRPWAWPWGGHGVPVCVSWRTFWKAAPGHSSTPIEGHPGPFFSPAVPRGRGATRAAPCRAAPRLTVAPAALLHFRGPTVSSGVYDVVLSPLRQGCKCLPCELRHRSNRVCATCRERDDNQACLLRPLRLAWRHFARPARPGARGRRDATTARGERPPRAVFIDRSAFDRSARQYHCVRSTPW